MIAPPVKEMVVPILVETLFVMVTVISHYNAIIAVQNPVKRHKQIIMVVTTQFCASQLHVCYVVRLTHRHFHLVQPDIRMRHADIQSGMQIHRFSSVMVRYTSPQSSAHLTVVRLMIVHHYSDLLTT